MFEVRYYTSKACDLEYQSSVCNRTCFEIFWLEYEQHRGRTFTEKRRPRGKAGNLMFQIAALIGVAKRRGFTPQSRNNHYKFEWFETPRLYVNVSAVNVTNVGEGKYATYQTAVESFDGSHNWTLGGYRCSWKYFDNAKDEVQ
ncbi:hypothetical protein MAR_012964 [Mya arenaria]|uniref:Uncharacterized protein n=1 Tax=Mya arenaria TaxID=6604 RepID=A0ABY7FYL9_MYAAR|nr:hypothetical protein MAR_012964 [Mya arenaria]